MDSFPFLKTLGLTRFEAESVLNWVKKMWEDDTPTIRFFEESGQKMKVWKPSEAFFAGMLAGMRVQCETCRTERRIFAIKTEVLTPEMMPHILRARQKDGKIVDESRANIIDADLQQSFSDHERR